MAQITVAAGSTTTVPIAAGQKVILTGQGIYRVSGLGGSQRPTVDESIDSTSTVGPFGDTCTVQVWGSGSGALYEVVSPADVLDQNGRPASVSGAGISWSNLPPPTTPQTLYINDVGLGGSFWRSNGAVWSLVGGSCVIAQSAVAVSCTASTAEEVLQSVSIPAGVMGISGALRLTTLWSCAGAVGTKTLRARLGATALGGSAWLAMTRAAVAAEYVSVTPSVLRNRNAVNSQVTFSPANGGTSTTTSSALGTFTEDTSATMIFALTGQKSTAGETLTLEGYSLELLR